MISPREHEAGVMLPVYGQLDLDLVDADGVHVRTADGRELMDLYGGHAVCALGYNHPALTRALAGKALHFQSNAVALHERARAAEALLSLAPAPLARVFFANSGAEVNENALRLACLLTGRNKVVAVEHGFHGRTAAAATVTWGARQRWYGFPNTPFDVEFVPRDDVAAAAAAVDSATAAVIVEPVQGVAGAYDLAPAFLHALADNAAANGAMLIIDEVQTGCGRSGFGFATERLGLQADMITAAKSLGGGFPCAALLTTAAVANELRHGDLGTTFGGGPLAAAAISAVIETIQRDDLLANVRARETELQQLAGIGPVRSVSGMGLLIGLHTDGAGATLRQALLARGFLTGGSAAPNVTRLLPPLTLSAEHVAALRDALIDIGDDAHAGL
ncbi:MAG: aminotransferase class III-fold pyridoxal phosphate-dependent enzyme [Pseudomonadota bacterium]